MTDLESLIFWFLVGFFVGPPVVGFLVCVVTVLLPGKWRQKVEDWLRGEEEGAAHEVEERGLTK